MIHIRKQAGFTSALAFSTHAHTYAHLLTQGNEKYYIFIKARRIYARKLFVSHLQNTEMLQSVEQTKSFFQYPIIPNSRTGHWAESIKPRLVCMIQSSKNMRYIQCRKGKEVAIERRHFSEETTEAAFRSFCIPR